MPRGGRLDWLARKRRYGARYRKKPEGMGEGMEILRIPKAGSILSARKSGNTRPELINFQPPRNPAAPFSRCRNNARRSVAETRKNETTEMGIVKIVKLKIHLSFVYDWADNETFMNRLVKGIVSPVCSDFEFIFYR